MNPSERISKRKLAEKISNTLIESKLCIDVIGDKVYNNTPKDRHLRFREMTEEELIIVILKTLESYKFLGFCNESKI